MKLDVFRRLRALEDAQGKEYGKLVQKLLAIAFLEGGAERIVERGVQGIDLEVTLPGDRRIAIEVKTAREKVTLGAKDVAGLAAREREGFVPYVAVLPSRLLEDWIFARYHEGELRPGSYAPTRLRPYRDPALEGVVRNTFPAAVVRHAEAARERGQGALDEVLRGYAAFEPA